MNNCCKIGNILIFAHSSFKWCAYGTLVIATTNNTELSWYARIYIYGRHILVTNCISEETPQSL